MTSKTSDVLIEQLHNEILKFRGELKALKKSATKSQLVNLLAAVVEFPVENTVVLTADTKAAYDSAIEAKNLLIHANVQILIEKSNELKKGEQNVGTSQEN